MTMNNGQNNESSKTRFNKCSHNTKQIKAVVSQSMSTFDEQRIKLREQSL